MIKTWLSYLLIALLACQAVLSIADSHEMFPAAIQPSGTKHIASRDENSILGDFVAFHELASSPLDANNGGDSYHCCHFHSAYIPTMLSVKIPVFVGLPNSCVDQSVSDGLVVSLFRPPKS